MNTITSLLCITALTLAVACDQADDGRDIESPENVSPVSDDAVDELAIDVDPDAACQWHCKPCPPNQVCTQTCRQIGNCGSGCTEIAICVEGYHWDDDACACLPDVGEGCGDVVCPPGTECCNASCGICVEPGGFCTQQVCDSTEPL